MTLTKHEMQARDKEFKMSFHLILLVWTRHKTQIRLQVCMFKFKRTILQLSWIQNHKLPKGDSKALFGFGWLRFKYLA